MTEERQFPILLSSETLRRHPGIRFLMPWSFVERYRDRIELNHGARLEAIAKRGGLCPIELWLAAHDLPLRADEVPESEAMEWLEQALKDEPVVYPGYALQGTILALGGNLWNGRVSRAVRDRGPDTSELTAAAEVFFAEILPELQNYMEQKIVAERKQATEQAKLPPEEVALPLRAAEAMIRKLAGELSCLHSKARCGRDLEKCYTCHLIRQSDLLLLGEEPGVLAQGGPRKVKP